MPANPLAVDEAAISGEVAVSVWAAHRRAASPLAAVALLALCGCAPLMAAGSAISAASAVYGEVERVNSAAEKVIAAGCAEYEAKKQVAYARISLGAAPAGAGPKATSIAAFGDAACKSPPTSGDPLELAIWLGQLSQQMSSVSTRP